jgi:hypothetical protein
MSNPDAAVSEANRAKEKELRKREDLYRAKLADLLRAKDVVDSLTQELDAREVVLAEAEAKHGSLLKREEEADVRERDLSDRERQLNERASSLAARETALEQDSAALREEHEKRMFPLAALEQEVYRREAELRSLEVDHEAKLRAFQKRVHQEEERERLREKQVRDLEAKAKDALAKAERREKDAENQQTALAEKNKALKAGQVELETRDRDLKWRDEQLRLAQAEVHVTKGRLMTWERELDLRHETLESKRAALDAKDQELEMKDLAVTDRMALVLTAEKEARGREVDKGLDEAADLRAKAESNAEAAARQKASAQEEETRVEALRTEIATLRTAAQKKEDLAIARKAKLDEKERAIKDWIAELEWREQQLAKREAQYGKDLNAAVGGSVSLAALQAKPSDGASEPARPAILNSGIVQANLSRARDSYLAGTAVPARRAQKSAKAPLHGAANLPASAPDDTFLVESEQEAIAEELDRHVAEVAHQFSQCSVKFYSMSDEGVRHVFSSTERDTFKGCFEAEEQWKEDVHFLNSAFFLRNANALNAGPTGFTTNQQWQQWFAAQRKHAKQRKRQIQSVRLSRLSQIVELFQRKEESDGLSKYFPLNHFRILRNRNNSPPQPGAAAPDDPADRDADETHKPVDARRRSVAAQAQGDIKRAVDSLPAYLKKVYEE